jgi:hypothetical protein
MAMRFLVEAIPLNGESDKEPLLTDWRLFLFRGEDFLAGESMGVDDALNVCIGLD